MTGSAIEVRDLRRVFPPRRARGIPDRRPVTALDGVSLEVPRGMLFGLLGPNGAGKTTMIKILATLLLPTEGTAQVAGFDVVSQARAVRERIAVVSGGETSGYGLLTVREQLWMYARFHGMPSKPARARIDELLGVVGLYEHRHRKISTLSTGMRQKMHLVRGLLPDPDILFLDEPTVGLDVAAARDIRAYVGEWMRAKPGRTILLTTHYLHEADAMCDRVAIIHQGSIVADDTPSALRRRAAGGSVFVVTTQTREEAPALTGVAGVERVDTLVRDERTELRVTLREDGVIAGVVRALADGGHTIVALEKMDPSLEDAFVDIVGMRIEAAEGQP